MRRREFITLIGGAVVGWPIASQAQRAMVRLIGILLPGQESESLTQHWLSTFRQALQQLGWTEGLNYRIECRFGHDDTVGRLPAMAKELVELQPEVIFTVTASASLAVKRLTESIPIVFAAVGDPLGAGLVSNLARPGGNVTGFAVSAGPTSGKRVELLKDINPSISRATLMFNPNTSTYRGTASLSDFLAAAARLGIEPIVVEVQHEAEIETVIAGLAREPKGGLFVGQDIFNIANRASIIALVARYRVPAIYPFDYFAQEGGLMSYGADASNIWRQAAGYVSRILKGEKSGDLPVQQPTNFKLVINLKTAKSLGLAVPPSLLARADEIIE